MRMALVVLHLLQSPSADSLVQQFLGLRHDYAGARACGRLAIATRHFEGLQDAELCHYECYQIEEHLFWHDHVPQEHAMDVGDFVMDE